MTIFLHIILSFIACIKGDIAHFLLAKDILEHVMDFMENS